MLEMIYRLISRTNSADGSCELVLTQKMSRFDHRRPSVITLKAFLFEATPLSNAVLADELEIEFKDRQIEKIDDLPLENVLDFENEFTIDFNFLSGSCAAIRQSKSISKSTNRTI
jgi:hypothetical protein